MAIFLPMRPRVRGRERSLVGVIKAFSIVRESVPLKILPKAETGGGDGLDADTLQFTFFVSLSSGSGRSACRHSEDRFLRVILEKGGGIINAFYPSNDNEMQENRNPYFSSQQTEKVEKKSIDLPLRYQLNYQRTNFAFGG
ncbi:hypothetical protein CEXT_523401 [Caerostris extrusa]|uniref:Uncharacterized protein n=1 Tax=Caerostris extrusa TaxID=172846 RepID=A0AAV4Y6C9_CAEEX|nr:hypothetical protein CEXT_523401 [Caerostris extrusa]